MSQNSHQDLTMSENLSKQSEDLTMSENLSKAKRKINKNIKNGRMEDKKVEKEEKKL